MLQNLTTELQTRVPGRATSNFSQSPEAKYDHMQSVLVDRESF